MPGPILVTLSLSKKEPMLQSHKSMPDSFGNVCSLYPSPTFLKGLATPLKGVQAPLNVLLI